MSNSDKAISEKQLAFFEKRLEDRGNKFDLNTERYKKWTFSLRIAIILLGASITVLAGWSWGSDSNLTQTSRNLILVFGTLSTAIASFSGFWNVEEYWLQNRVISEELKSLRDRVKFLKSREETIADYELANLWSEYELILGQRTDFWRRTLNSNLKNNSDGNGLLNNHTSES